MIINITGYHHYLTPLLPAHVFSEADKNVSATPASDPYGYSKVQCEKEIESFVASLPSNERFSYVMINPSAIYGPLLTTAHIAGSPQVSCLNSSVRAIEVISMC